MISQMTIGKKLMLAMGAMVALTLGLAWSGLSSVGSLGKELNVTATFSARKMELIGQINLEFANMSRAQRGLVLYSLLKDPAKAEEVGRPFLTAADRIDEALAELRPMLQTERGKQLVESITASLSGWRPLYSDLHRLCEAQSFDGELKDTLGNMVAHGNEAIKATTQLVQLQKELFAASALKASEETSRSRWIAVVLIGVCLAVGGVVIYIVMQISKSLRQLAGDMTDSAGQVNSASAQVSASSQALSQGASEQAASLEETSASTEAGWRTGYRSGRHGPRSVCGARQDSESPA